MRNDYAHLIHCRMNGWIVSATGALWVSAHTSVQTGIDHCSLIRQCFGGTPCTATVRISFYSMDPVKMCGVCVQQQLPGRIKQPTILANNCDWWRTKVCALFFSYSDVCFRRRFVMLMCFNDFVNEIEWGESTLIKKKKFEDWICYTVLAADFKANSFIHL